MNIESLSGIGEKRKAVLNENGIFTCEDIIEYFPAKHLDLSHVEGFKVDGKNRLIKVTLTEEAKVIRIKGGLNYTSAKVVDSENNHFTCVWFNQPYMKSKLKAFEEYYVYGKNSPTKKNNFVVQRCISDLSQNMLSIYKSFDGIGQQTIKSLVEQSFKNVDIKSPLDKFTNMPLVKAYKSIHAPLNALEIEESKTRIEEENAALLLAAINSSKGINRPQKTQNYTQISKIYNDFCNKLPFKLTFGQEKAISDINKDMQNPYTINRVIDGDVGSGKTMVAFYAMYVASFNNYNSCMIAPTEILAKQHYENAKKMFNERAVYVSGKLTTMQRRALQEKLENVTGLMIFGTKALLEERYKIKSLALVVVDEQHRFGVSDRAKLAGKGLSVDVLSMSATPIPRTLSLILRGDADISEIRERPFANKVQTNIVRQAKEEDMWNFIQDKIEKGSKVFVVCSKIGDEEDDDLLEYSATNVYKRLKTWFMKIGLLTGKVESSARDKLLESFAKGETKIIVATTIVEVGIDIPDSDIMVIATPERFGLATLHQLRGRVGRNGKESYCFCLGTNLNEKSYERLQFFAKTNDGFALADFDYENRGAGDVFGTKQHGKSSEKLHISLNMFRKMQNLLEKIQKDDFKTYNAILEKSKEKYDDIFNKVIMN